MTTKIRCFITGLLTGVILLGTGFVFANNGVFDTIPSYAKAKYLKDTLEKALTTPDLFPRGSIWLKGKINGDIAVSVWISKEGKLNDIKLVHAKHEFIGDKAVEAVERLDKEAWKAGTINNVPVDGEYLIIFRYKFNAESTKVNFRQQASEKIRKGKYKKAKKIYSKAIKKYPYEYVFYYLRSRINKKLGNTPEAQEDMTKYETLRRKILCVVDIKISAYRNGKP